MLTSLDQTYSSQIIKKAAEILNSCGLLELLAGFEPATC